jgi:hypothetical protein
MQLLRKGAALLLDLLLRFPDLQHVHGREPLGVYLQRGELAVSGLRLSAPLLGGSIPTSPPLVGGVRGGGVEKA